MSIRGISVFISSCFLLSCLCSCDYFPSISGEEDCLRDIFENTSGHEWYNTTNWCGYKPISEWYGISTNASENVVAIDLPRNNLKGHFSLSDYFFNHLERLDLSGNKLNSVKVSLPCRVHEVVLSDIDVIASNIDSHYDDEYNYSEVFNAMLLTVHNSNFDDLRIGDISQVNIENSSFESISFSDLPGYEDSEQEIEDDFSNPAEVSLSSCNIGYFSTYDFSGNLNIIDTKILDVSSLDANMVKISDSVIFLDEYHNWSHVRLFDLDNVIFYKNGISIKLDGEYSGSGLQEKLNF